MLLPLDGEETPEIYPTVIVPRSLLLDDIPAEFSQRAFVE